MLDLEIGELFLHANKKKVKFNFDQSMQILENEESLSIDISLPTNGVEETILMLYVDEKASLGTKDDKPPWSNQTSQKSLVGL